MMLNLSGLQGTLGVVARLPLKLVPDGLRVPVMQGPMKGIRWITGSSTHGCWLGTYERDKQRLLFEALGPNDVFFDIGANVGLYTLLASQKTNSICSFEPLPANLRRLREHLALNNLSHVKVLPLALSDLDGEANFEDHADSRSSNTRLCSTGNAKVIVARLDTLMAEGKIPAPTVMKIDVEHAELSLLHGAERLISSSRPIIFLATHTLELHRKCSDLLSSWGFRITDLTHDELLAVPK
jgi:FkbM family methyltransferase